MIRLRSRISRDEKPRIHSAEGKAEKRGAAGGQHGGRQPSAVTSSQNPL